MTMRWTGWLVILAVAALARTAQARGGAGGRAGSWGVRGSGSPGGHGGFGRTSARSHRHRHRDDTAGSLVVGFGYDGFDDDAAAPPPPRPPPDERQILYDRTGNPCFGCHWGGDEPVARPAQPDPEPPRPSRMKIIDVPPPQAAATRVAPTAKPVSAPKAFTVPQVIET